MTTIYDILNQLRQVAHSKREQGELFERLMLAFLRTDPQYKQLFSQVWPWIEWPGRNGRVDTGIDLVAEEADTGDIWAIQCKFHEPEHRIQKSDLDSFFTESGKHPFSKRMIIVTAPMSKHAEEACHGQQIRVSILDMEALEKSTIDWSRFSWDRPDFLPSRPKKTLRPHQEAAIADVLKGFRNHDRGKLIMACGTGKTFTALKLTEKLVPEGGLVLFLVPSIALLSQTLREWTAEAEVPLRSFAVCSDSKVGKGDGEDLRVSDLAYPATTNAERLVAEIKKELGKAVTVIFSTYQSIDVVSKAQKAGLPAFDLVICDEAHRTTGVVQGEEASYFTKVHEEKFLQAKKRLYMTATPRIYADASKTKAKEANVELYSMDDESIYGPEFHRLNFSKAVEMGILSDYKVVILAVDEKHVLHHLGHRIYDQEDRVKLDDVAKIVGCWNALSKRFLANDALSTENAKPMQRAVAFTTSIKNSKRVTELFEHTVEDYVHSLPRQNESPLVCEVRHVDGTHNIVERNSKLQWLKENPGENKCRILSNARCLTEGVDVPALDAVIFLNPRNSQVDVVQAIGRVMRKAEGKEYGYVILPVAVSPENSPEEVLNKDPQYKVVWQVLNALRAHDDRFNDLVNKLELNKRKPDQVQIIGVGGDSEEWAEGENQDGQSRSVQLTLNLEQIQEWREAIYAKIVEKCGERRYWESWAKDVATIAERHRTHINAILEGTDPKAREAQKAFSSFLEGLRTNINESIGQEEAIEMLAQHLVTKPVFDALFENYAFSANNPVSQSMQKVIDILEGHALWKEAESLERFYESVRKRASGIDNIEGKQKIIIELYDKFFRTAFPKMAERLGIVYTPIEVVDFILKSAEDVLQEEFGKHLSDEGVHILDPFTGTGTFIVRLLQSGLIRPEDLVRKYREELHANEIVLLAYYIAAINIEEAYHRLSGQDYEPFPGIVLTDTFQLGEDKNTLAEALFPENNERISRQNRQEIRVIVGNPPYSIGQESQNDNNQNLTYPHLDQRITETYAAASKAVLKKGLYDSYIRAIRWASDRIGDKGVIAFVTNNRFIDSNTTDGLRKYLYEEFTSIYCFNLRGAIRGKIGDTAKREGQNVFNIMTGVAITIMVKNPSKKGSCVIRYHDIGDYLSREQKLEKIRQAGSIKGLSWTEIKPNAAHDWINQRSEDFTKLIALGDKKGGEPALFSIYSLGVSTNRDNWTYNFSISDLQNNMQAMIGFYNRQVAEFKALGKVHPTMDDVDSFIDTDPRKISWSRALKQDLCHGKRHPYEENCIVPAMYRPFCKQWLYFSRAFNEMVSQIPKLFPDPSVENLMISVTGKGARLAFSALMVDSIPNLHFHDTGQCFPLYYYEDQAEQRQQNRFGGLFEGIEEEEKSQERFIRHDAITDWALNEFRRRYGDTVSKEDIFYYVYGVLHSPEYRERFAADLKKMLPRIPAVSSAENFWTFSKAGRKLADWHLNYETVDPWPLDEIHNGNPQANGFYRVEKMHFGKGPNGKPDKTTIVYNANITLSGIPLKAYDYVVNGKPAIEWIMDRYKVIKDKDSGIINDPNEWSDDPRYIVNLIKRIVRVSVETQKIIKGLPELGLVYHRSS